MSEPVQPGYEAWIRSQMQRVYDVFDVEGNPWEIKGKIEYLLQETYQKGWDDHRAAMGFGKTVKEE